MSEGLDKSGITDKMLKKNTEKSATGGPAKGFKTATQHHNANVNSVEEFKTLWQSQPNQSSGEGERVKPTARWGGCNGHSDTSTVDSGTKKQQTTTKDERKRPARTSMENHGDEDEESSDASNSEIVQPFQQKKKANPGARHRKDSFLAVGTKVRHRGDLGWQDCVVESSTEGGTFVKYGPNVLELLTDDEALVAKAAYELKHHVLDYPRPGTGTVVSRLFQCGNLYDGTVMNQSALKSRVIFINGVEEWLEDEELKVSAVTHALFRSPHCREACHAMDGPELLSIIWGTGQNNRKGVGTLVRKQFRLQERSTSAAWYNGRVESQEQYTSLIRYPPSEHFLDGYTECLADDELEACALAYSLHQSKDSWTRPAVGTRIRVRYESGWYDGAVTGVNEADKYTVKFLDGENTGMTLEEVVVYAADYIRCSRSLKDDSEDEGMLPGASNDEGGCVESPSNSDEALTDKNDDLNDYMNDGEDSYMGDIGMGEGSTEEGSMDEDTSDKPVDPDSLIDFVVKKASKVFKPKIGTKIWKRTKGQLTLIGMPVGGVWRAGEVISLDFRNARARVLYEDKKEENLTWGEAHHCHCAYLLHKQSSWTPRPTEGTIICSRYNGPGGWRNAIVGAVGSSGTKSYVVYDDGAETYMSDNEVHIGKLTFKLRNRS